MKVIYRSLNWPARARGSRLRCQPHRKRGSGAKRICRLALLFGGPCSLPVGRRVRIQALAEFHFYSLIFDTKRHVDHSAKRRSCLEMKELIIEEHMWFERL